MRKFAAAFGVAAVLVGCGMRPEDNYKKMRANLVARDFEAANAYIDRVKEDIYSEDNRLLFYMDKGMVLHLAKKYEESNQYLEKAKDTAEELWTESIGANAAAWVTTDNSLPYQGEDFEKVLIHFMTALNYIGLGNYDSARVEARQVTAKLELFNQKYAEQEDGVPSAYRDDAFARWLSGKLRETDAGKEALNEAWIDYRKALEIYRKDYAERYATAAPRIVIEDALRVLEALGHDFKDEYNSLKGQFASVPFKTEAEVKGKGEIVFLHLNGEAPYKIDEFWDSQAGDDWIRVAFPKFIAKVPSIKGARMSVGGQTADTQLAENITAIAIQNLDDKMARIKAKAIARAVAKYIASKAAQAAGKEVGGGAGALLQVGGALFGAASNIAEEADKRSWITLPANVGIARTFVEPGDTMVEVEFYSDNGAVVDRVSLPVTVKADEITFVAYRTFQ